MQSINLVAGYLEEFEWETVKDGLKPELKKIQAMKDSEPEDLQARYDKLAKLGIVLDEIEADQKCSVANDGGDKEEAEVEG